MTPADQIAAGKRLRAARVALGFTSQAAFAKALRLTGKHAWRTVSDWETGKRPIPGPVQVAVELMLKDRGLALKALAGEK